MGLCYPECKRARMLCVCVVTYLNLKEAYTYERFISIQKRPIYTELECCCVCALQCVLQYCSVRKRVAVITMYSS